MHKYDRRIPAPLPPHRMLDVRPSGILPPSIDLRAWCGPVKDQGAEGACTAHAGTSAVEWIFRKYLGKAPIFSPQYTYAKELIAQGNFPQDVGSDGTTLCGTLVSSGCCVLDIFPYVAGQISMPSTQQDLNASQYKMGAYHGLQGSAVAQSVLGDPVPWPVAIGFTVYESFESQEVTQTGIMPVPDDSENILGGHEVLICGYDLGDTPTLRPAACPKAFLVQNSWGAGWALGGFFWMPAEILDRQDTDLKIVHSGHPWK